MSNDMVIKVENLSKHPYNQYANGNSQGGVISIYQFSNMPWGFE